MFLLQYYILLPIRLTLCHIICRILISKYPPVLSRVLTLSPHIGTKLLIICPDLRITSHIAYHLIPSLIAYHLSQEWVRRDPSWAFSPLALAMNNHPMTQPTSHPKSIPWGKFIKIGGAPLPLLWAKGLSRCPLRKRGQAIVATSLKSGLALA